MFYMRSDNCWQSVRPRETGRTPSGRDYVQKFIRASTIPCWDDTVAPVLLPNAFATD